MFGWAFSPMITVAAHKLGDSVYTDTRFLLRRRICFELRTGKNKKRKSGGSLPVDTDVLLLSLRVSFPTGPSGEVRPRASIQLIV